MPVTSRLDRMLERERLRRFGMDALDLAEGERAHRLERQERSDDFTPASGLFRIERPLLTCSIYRGDA